LRFDDPHARGFQAEAEDSKATLLLKLLWAQSAPSWWFSGAEKERLWEMQAKLPSYARRQPLRPHKRPGPHPTLKKIEWQIITEDVRPELRRLFTRDAPLQEGVTIEKIFATYLSSPKRVQQWAARRETYTDTTKDRVMHALTHFLDLEVSTIAHAIARARGNRRHER
jgi:hypothetical protein